MSSTVNTNSDAGDSHNPSSNNNTDDANTLTSQIRSGNKQSFEHLYRTYHKRLVEAAYSYTRSLPIAEEIVQEVFLRLWQNRATLEIRDSITVYLYGAVRNGGINYQRQNKVRDLAAQSISTTDTTPGMSAATPAPGSALEEQDAVRAILRVIDTLSETVREAFLLRWRHRLSYAEIAKTTGITEAAAMMRVSRAKAAIQAELGRLQK